MPSKGADYLQSFCKRSEHTALVDSVRKTIAGRSAGQKVSIKKPGINHTPHSLSYKKNACLVDVSGLSTVLTCVVESCVEGVLRPK